MPVTCDQQRAKWRIVERSGRVSLTDSGNPVDGGGHDDREACMAQARAINASLEKRAESDKQEVSKELGRAFDAKLQSS